jgi:uncharacterized protein
MQVHECLRRRLSSASLFQKEGYDNPSVYCDGLYATYQHIQSVLEDHLYVSRPGREPLRVGDELARV